MMSILMNRKMSTLAVIGIVMALLAACGGSGNTSTSPTPTPTTSTTTASATLKHIPVGSADLSWDASSHVLTVKLALSGLAPSSMHPAHIHTGSCSNQGNVIYPLQTIMADAKGTASVTSTVNNVMKGIPATGWYVNVHNGPGLTTNDQFLPIVCGDVANSNTSTTAAQSVQVAMSAAPSASASESASGMATLTLSGSKLTVKVTVSGLAANSTHAAHIHSGSCMSQGAVVYPLKPLTADASGNASETTVIDNVSSIPSSGWYVNVHYSTALSTQTGFNPITCGDVTVQ